MKTSLPFLISAAAISIGLMNPERSFPQSPSSPLPSFDVASVKLADLRELPLVLGMSGGPGTNSPGQFTCTHITLRPLVLKAYDLRPYQLVGPPSLDGDKYDITAKIPPSATRKQFNLMLQDLLLTRFGLSAHRETRELPIYELNVAKGGPKLKVPEDPRVSQPQAALPERKYDKNGNPELPPGRPGLIIFGLNPGARVSGVSARMVTIDILLGGLANLIGRPVVDKTGLGGKYDFKMSFAPNPARMADINPSPALEPASGQAGLLDAASEPAPDLFKAFEQQLGLKLEGKKGPVVVLVVDHVNKTPTGN